MASDWKVLKDTYEICLERSGYDSTKALELYNESYQYLEMVCGNLSDKDCVKECRQFNRIWEALLKKVEEANQ